VRVINGLTAFRTETSKAFQLSLLEHSTVSAGARHQSRVAGARSRARAALSCGRQSEHRWQQRRHRAVRSSEDERAVAEHRVELESTTPRATEFIPARASHITRVEILGGKYLYAINVFSTGDSFNLCPAEARRMMASSSTDPHAQSTHPRKPGVEGYTPPAT
jgi:hypothetical protein